MKTGCFFLSVTLSLSFFSCKEQKSYLDLQPFSINHANVGDEAIDISFLLEKPAGKSRFITVQDGRLVFHHMTQVEFFIKII